jgi:hypothetical protein
MVHDGLDDGVASRLKPAAADRLHQDGGFFQPDTVPNPSKINPVLGNTPDSCLAETG